QLRLEAEGADLDDVAVVEDLVLDRLAVDAGGSAGAVADAPAAGEPDDDGMHGGDLGRHQAHVAAGVAAQDGDLGGQRTAFPLRGAVQDEQGGLVGVDADVLFVSHGSISTYVHQRKFRYHRQINPST